jgi:hypothetical protein
MILKNLFKKLKENKGVTGTDVAAAVTVIILTMGVVTAIYINVTNKVKENIRYSNATRIATQIMENVQAKPYDYLVNLCGTELSATSTSEEKFFDVNIPSGYSAKITTTKISGADALDVVRKVTVDVSYKISNKTNTISLATIKEKELLEQTNKPDISLIDLETNYCYPIKKDGNVYKVTDLSDPNWYNYDSVNGKNCALVFVTANASLEIGEQVTINGETGGGLVYAWIPRFRIRRFK